jgi:hypothetical protein
MPGRRTRLHSASSKPAALRANATQTPSASGAGASSSS